MKLLLGLLVLVATVLANDFYKALGVDQDATEKQIKKAYRKLSLKYHPDKNRGDENAKKKFDEVRDAYECLSDRKKRSVYDTGGVDAVKKHVERGNQPDRDMFGRKRQRKASMHLQISVSLEQLYTGGEYKHTIQRTAICRGCKNKSSGKCAQCGRCPDEVQATMQI